MTDYALQQQQLANFNDSGMGAIAPAFQYGKRHAPNQKEKPCNSDS